MILPWTRKACARAGVVLLILFATVLAVSLLNHLNLDCGCSMLFMSDQKISWSLVIRDMSMAILMLGLVLWAEKKWGKIPELMRSGRTHFSTVVVGILLFGMGTTILSLKQRNALLAAKVTPAPALAVGDTVSPFPATGLDGAKSEIGYAGQGHTVLFAFSTKCPHCVEMLPAWNLQFAEKKDSRRYVGVALMSNKEDLEHYLHEHEVLFPTCLPDNLQSFSSAYKLSSVPQTIEIAENGKVVAIQKGFRSDGIRQITP